MELTSARLAEALDQHYRVHHEIGRGGMATVYLAEDLKHRRRVAIKVLHPELGAVLGVDRFLSEIRVTASLQHPNILPLFDSGSTDGLVYYVMPFVEGETLRVRIDREQQLPIADVVRITQAVASALDYAHRHGVIHRDIKPENVLLAEGQPLVADFGIARAVSHAAGERITQTGISVGTPQYMSPEQATAERHLDGRTDIYSLGAVAYEMLTGEPPFTGPNAPAILAKLMTEPVAPVTARRRSVPPHAAAAIHRALEKVPADRFATGAEFAAALAGETSPGAGARPEPTSASGSPRHTLRGLAGAVGKPAAILLAGITIGALVMDASRRRPGEAPVVRASIPVPETPISQNGQYGNIAISPDGSTIAYRQQAGLAVRAVREGTETLLPGTAGAGVPTFSPDGRSIAFSQAARLRIVSIAGGSVADLGPFGTVGLRWERDGYIYAVRSNITAGIWRRPASGGAAELVTRIDTTRGEVGHVWPQLVLGGKAILYTSLGPSGGAEDSRVVVERLDTHERHVLVEQAMFGRVVATGHLLYAKNDGTVFAVPFDERRLATVGHARPVLSGVETASWGGSAFFAVADNGTMIYLPRTRRRFNTLALVDRTGRALTTLPAAFASDQSEPTHNNVSLARDGRRVVATGRRHGQSDIWLLDAQTWDADRFTFEPTEEEYPVWSPDGRFVAYTAADPGTTRRILIKSTGSGASPRVLRRWPRHAHISSWSFDGRWIALYDFSEQGQDLWAIPVSGSDSILVAGSAANEVNGAFSPDGRWVAYQSDESGRAEIYVASFPRLDERFQVSNDGGALPRWDATGRRLYFWQNGRIVRLDVESRAGFRKGALTRLFAAPRPDFDVTSDGSRFVVALPDSTAAHVHIVVGWFDELRKK